MNAYEFKEEARKTHQALDYLEKVLNEDEIENNLTDQQLIFIIRAIELLSYKTKKDSSDYIKDYLGKYND